MRQQKALTVVARIKKDHVSRLETLLDEIDEGIREGAKVEPCVQDATPERRIKDTEQKPRVEFAKIGTTSFASWIILKADPPYPPTLVFECNYEGAQDDYLDEFVGKAGPVLHEIYSHCEGFDREKKDADLRGYLESHAEKYSAFYVGCPYQSQEGIKKAVEARRIIEDFLDRQSPGGQELQQLRKAIQSHLEQNKLASLDGLITPLDKLRLRRIWNVVLAGFVVFAFAYILSLILSVRFWSALIGLVGVVVGLVAVWLIALRLQEIRESKAPEEAKRRIDPRLFHKDDRYLQNHLTTLVEIKPGRLRLYTLKVVLSLINVAAKYFFIIGHLGHIPTIHFARWLIIDKDQPIPRLLFLSNFDGSWNSYLGDFVDKAWFGLNGVWGNTPGFPPTRYLFGAGAKQIVEFKQWSREHNVYANVWYSAYPDTSVRNILTDIDIAEKIGKELDEQETLSWLRLL